MGVTFDDIADAAVVRTTTVDVCLRGDLLARQETLRRAFDRAAVYDALHNEPDTAPGAAAELVDVEAEIREAEVTFRVRSLGRRAWRDLLAEHPPRKQDKGLDHNPDTFYDAAIVACVTEPAGITMEKWQRLTETIGLGVYQSILDAVKIMNVEDHRRLGESAAASELVRASGPSSSSVAGAASPGLSSSDES